MIKQTTFIAFILSAVFLLASENSFAQIQGGGPCLLGVGNCSTNNNNGNVEKDGRKYLDGNQAAELLRSKNYGSRYLLVLSSTYDPNTRCNIEIRAWFSGIEGQTNDGRMIITYGPTRTVQVCSGTTYSAQQINQMEANIEYSRKWLYAIQTNPSGYANAQAWINYYTQYINNVQAQVATSAP